MPLTTPHGFVLPSLPAPPYSSISEAYISQIYELLYQLITSSISPQMKSVKVNLTAAQIKTLNSIPVIVVPAPAAGNYIQVISSAIQLNANTLAFTTGGFVLQFAVGAPIPASAIIGSTPPYFSFSVDPTNNANQKGKGVIYGNQAAILQNDAILFTSDADSLVGDMTATLFIQYLQIDIATGNIIP